MVDRLQAWRRYKLELVESDLPVERLFVALRDDRASGGHVSSVRRRKLPPFFSGHRAAARRLTASGRNFIRAFVELQGGTLAELQIVSRTSQHPALISLAPYIGLSMKSTFVLVGASDQGGLLMHETGAVALRPGDLWLVQGGVSSLQVETTPYHAELLLLSLES